MGPSNEIDSNDGLKPIGFAFKEVKGIGLEKGVTRRDPSDVIEVSSIYFVYYTKVFGQAGGYWGDLWYATSSDNGYTWKEEGSFLGVGEKGAFDSQAVFTPNILLHLLRLLIHLTHCPSIKFKSVFAHRK